MSGQRTPSSIGLYPTGLHYPGPEGLWGGGGGARSSVAVLPGRRSGRYGSSGSSFQPSFSYAIVQPCDLLPVDKGGIGCILLRFVNISCKIQLLNLNLILLEYVCSELPHPAPPATPISSIRYACHSFSTSYPMNCGGAPCAVRKVGCFPPPVAMGPIVLNSAPHAALN